MTTLVIMQPGYLPWLGFFDQFARSDIFMYYDIVQYDKNGWRNRNRIKSQSGPIWLTIPVKYKGLNRPIIKEIKIDGTKYWAKKHISSIRQYYSRSPFLDRYMPELEVLLNKPWGFLMDLDVELIDLLCRWLNIKTRIEYSSDYDIKGNQSERLANYCELFHATNYLSGDAAKSYLDLSIFEERNINVEWHNYNHPIYSQQYGEFIPYLSVIDLLLNMGDSSKEILDNSALQKGK